MASTAGGQIVNTKAGEGCHFEKYKPTGRRYPTAAKATAI